MKENSGTLENTGIPRLLNLIYQENDPAGVLEIVKEPVRKQVFFKNGVPVFASSNSLNEVLGRLLMSEGIITQKDYEETLEIVLRDKKRHGEVLIERGLITARELDDFLAIQFKRRLWKLFGWLEGRFHYTRTDSIPAQIPEYPQSPAALILEGLSHGFYPLVRIRRDLQAYMDKALHVSADAGRCRLGDLNLSIQETRFLRSFDGKKALSRILESTDLLAHRALALVATFIITGLVRTKDAPLPEAVAVKAPEAGKRPASPGRAVREGVAQNARLNAELLFMKASAALQKEDFKKAHAILSEICELNPLEAEYWACLGWALFNVDPDDEKTATKAEGIIKDSIDLNGELDVAWYYLGSAFLRKNREAEAGRAFSTALSKNPAMLAALAELKRTEIRQGVDAKTHPLERERIKRYVKAFGFKDDPFSFAPYAAETSLSASQKDGLDFLLKSEHEMAGPVLLTGRDAIGKTVIALELLRTLSGRKLSAGVVLNPPEDELGFVNALCRETGAGKEDNRPVDTASDVKTGLLRLDMRVSELNAQSMQTMMIIDRAETLSAGCVKIMEHVMRLKGASLVLIADPAIEARLRSSQFKGLDAEILSRFSLKKGMTPEETKEYVKRRVIAVTPKDKIGLPSVAITGEALSRVHELSIGLPGLVNRNMSRVFARAAELGVSVIEKSLLESVAGAG